MKNIYLAVLLGGILAAAGLVGLGLGFGDNSIVVGTATLGTSSINGVTFNGGTITGNINGSPTGNGAGLTNTSSTVVSPAGDTTLTGYEEFVIMAANHSCTLGSAATNSGHKVAITSGGNGTNAILTVSSQTIAGASKWTNTAQYTVTCLVSDGTNWQLAGSRGN